jgi:hypothetical protein
MDQQQVALVIQAALQAQQATQQVAITATVQAALAALAANAQQQQQQPGPFQIGMAANNNVIDYSKREGIKIGEGARAKLSIEFDLTPLKLHAFVTEVFDKGEDYGWNCTDGILNVPNAAGQRTNICQGYAMRSLEEVIADTERYAFTQTRKAQDSANLYMCLIGSLSPTAQTTILQFT